MKLESLSLTLPVIFAGLSTIAVTLGKALIVFVICRIAMNIITRIAEGIYTKMNLDSGVSGFARSVVRILLWVATAILVAETLGIETTSIVALVSVVSLALSLSLQNIMTNVFSGVTILATQPFKAGQFVEIAGVSGTVTELSIMHTTLETADHKQILIPNSEITNAKIINYSSEPQRRVDLTFSASYDTPTELVKKALYEAMEADPRILQDPAPFVGLQAYNANDIQYVTKCWCESIDYWGIYYDLNERVREVFAKYDIEFSYPHIVIHTENK